MRIRIKYFAWLREKVGKSVEDLNLTDTTRVTDVRRKIAELHDLEEETLLVALNGSFANPDDIIEESDEVAVFPPVSGG